MTQRAAIAAALASAEQTVATLRAALAALDGAPIAPATEPFVDDWLSTKEAMKLARVNSPGTIYTWCRLHGLGRKGKNKRWHVDRAPFLAFLRAREEE